MSEAEMGVEAAFKLENVVKGYPLPHGFVPVLRGVDLSVAPGEWVALLGASGSGKTTLLNLIGCLEKPDSGRVIHGGVDCGKLNDSGLTAIRRSKIGFVFQSYHLLYELNVLENVKLAAMLNFGKDADARARSLLEKVGLGERLTHRPTELSGGEQQRVAIARAMVNNPQMILADEPTGNLDSTTGAGILDLFNHLRDSMPDRIVVMVTHDKNVAALADRVVVIKDGILVET